MRYVHVKTREEVKFIRLGLDEKTLDPVVVYETLRGEVFIRPCSEFFDGRFVPEQKFRQMQEDQKNARATALRRPSTKKD